VVATGSGISPGKEIRQQQEQARRKQMQGRAPTMQEHLAVRTAAPGAVGGASLRSGYAQGSRMRSRR